MQETNNILSVLEGFTFEDPEAVGKEIAADFRKRRIEKALTREEIAAKADLPVGSVARFEQKGLVSLNSLIKLAIALEYVSEIRNIFAEPKFSTMEELLQIKRNTNKKKAYKK